MQAQKIQDVMTRDVVTVSPTAPIHEAARLMIDYGISGLPVLDARGDLIGMLSEGDLILRQRPRPKARWWHIFFDDGERMAREYRKATGVTVGEVMTRPVICVAADASLEAAAALLEEHRIRRLPVLRGGKLVGVVSRGDLVKALAAGPAAGAVPLSDAQLVSEMKRRMGAEPWVSNRGILIQAEGGVLELYGMVESQAEREALATMARSIPGCKEVESHLVSRPLAAAPGHA